MKSSLTLLIKLCLFTYILCLTPFFESLPQYLGMDVSNLTSSLYEYDLDEKTPSIKEQLNLMKINENILISDEQKEPFVINSGEYVSGNESQKIKTSKKVYIYNTHQQEEYADGKTVIDASIELANQLQEAGIQVIYESNDFKKWLSMQGLNYNYSYSASSYYLNEAIVQYGGFDLIIDFHRDAIPRESSYVLIDGESYAKMMCVVGGLSHNNKDITELSNTLTSYVNNSKNGVMKSVMVREAYYNQDIYNKMILVEVGSDKNTFEEVSKSTNLLANAIIQYLQG